MARPKSTADRHSSSGPSVGSDTMARGDLLPGVATAPSPPPVLVDSRSAVRRARRRAAVRDISQLFLVGGVDWIFLHWPYTHVPSMDRPHSVLVVALLNAALLTHIIVVRTFPRWSARRIAATWCLPERARFFHRGALKHVSAKVRSAPRDERGSSPVPSGTGSR